MSVKILHAADFHLDSAFGALTGEQAKLRRRESRALVERLSNYANQNQIDVVLLAGDLFDSETTYRETVEQLLAALGAMRARVFIAPGNHDYFGAHSPYATLDWPENVHVFTAAGVDRVVLEELGCTVYGAAFTDQAQEESLLSGFSAPEDGLIHLMVLHGDLSPMNHVGPDDIRIRELVERVGAGEVSEVIMATNPDTEGDTTAMYISRLLRPFGVKVTRLGFGVPVGSNLEFADDATMLKALEGRREM